MAIIFTVLYQHPKKVVQVYLKMLLNPYFRSTLFMFCVVFKYAIFNIYFCNISNEIYRAMNQLTFLHYDRKRFLKICPTLKHLSFGLNPQSLGLLPSTLSLDQENSQK